MSNADWYARRLNAPKPNQPTTPPTRPSDPVPYARPQAPGIQQPNVQASYDPATDQVVTRAQSSRNSERCPECMSGNYMAPTGTQRKRCYDCGYPIQQSGSGIIATGGSSSGGAATPAKQPAMGNGFQPTTIVDRIG